MKTLPLSVELSQLAIENSRHPLPAKSLVRKIEKLLGRRTDTLGHLKRKKLARQRNLGKDLTLQELRFDFEKRSFQLRLIRFRPRSGWEVQGFRFF
jgi:hypothetical protein